MKRRWALLATAFALTGLLTPASWAAPVPAGEQKDKTVTLAIEGMT